MLPSASPTDPACREALPFIAIWLCFGQVLPVKRGPPDWHLMAPIAARGRGLYPSLFWTKLHITFATKETGERWYLSRLTKYSTQLLNQWPEWVPWVGNTSGQSRWGRRGLLPSQQLQSAEHPGKAGTLAAVAECRGTLQWMSEWRPCRPEEILTVVQLDGVDPIIPARHQWIQYVSRCKRCVAMNVGQFIAHASHVT
jgi:hypothetical protein